VLKTWQVSSQEREYFSRSKVPPPPPQAQKLKKSLSKIGLNVNIRYFQLVTEEEPLRGYYVIKPFTYLLIYLFTYLLIYLLTYLLTNG